MISHSLLSIIEKKYSGCEKCRFSDIIAAKICEKGWFTLQDKSKLLRYVPIFGIYCNKSLRGFFLVQPTLGLE